MFKYKSIVKEGASLTLLEKIKKGENKTVEFKEKLPSNDSIIKTVISFSNTSGGLLIIGVRDNGEIIGIDNEDIFALQDKISSIIFDNCYPNIIPEIYTTNINGKLLLVIEIFRGNLLPYYVKNEGKNNGTYLRIGATNRKAGFDNILELERQRRNISFDEEIDYEYEFDTLNINPLRNQFISINKDLDIDKMINLKLIKIENNKIYPSKALLILLGYYENVRIKCSRFKGKTMDIFLDRKEYDSDIFSQLKNAENFILNHINLRAEINGLQRKDIPEIPIEAIREALVNAFVHRDYSNLGRDIKLGIYDDIVNIVSPGAFPNSIVEEDILNGRSEIRNRVIARIFKELGYIEQWGSGIKRIKSFCINSGLKEPLIRETNDFVDVEFFRLVDFNDLVEESFSGQIGGQIGGQINISQNQKEILNYIIKNPKITRTELSKNLNINPSAIQKHLDKLKSEGIIRRIGKTKGYWEIILDINN